MTSVICPSFWDSPNISMDDRTKICGRHCLLGWNIVVNGWLVSEVDLYVLCFKLVNDFR